MFIHHNFLFSLNWNTTKEMQFIGTAFEDYVLDQFLKVQLLFDESYKYVKVSQINGIPQSPVIANTSKSMFHKSSSLMKSLMENLNELSNITQIDMSSEFKKNIIKFLSIHKANFKNFTIDTLNSEFQSFLKNQKGLSSTDPQFYIQSIQLVDLLLICKSSSNEKNQLIKIRNSLLDCSYLQLPTITDEKFKTSICQSFNITKEQLNTRINTLNTVISKSQIVNFFQSGDVLSNTYTINDFENPEYYENWLLKSRNLENDMITLFTDPTIPSKNTNISIVPNQLSDTISLLVAISLNSNSSFFQGLIKCMQIWQINPFYIQFKFIEAAVSISKEQNDDKINPELVEKAFNLSYLAMPFQVQFIEWPLNEKKNFMSLSMKIYNESAETIKPCFRMFFQDQNTFTIVLSFLKLLKLNLKNVKSEIKEQLVNIIQQRLSSHKDKAGISDYDQKLKLDNMVKFLSLVSRDINLLFNWKSNNKDLNLSFQIFEIGSKILMSPTLEYIKKYVNELKSNNFNIVSNRENKVNFGSFIDLVNNLKARTNFKYDFQNEIFDDFYKIVQSWDNEMLSKTKNIISSDNLVRLDGCSYSSSVQNLILLFEGYIKLLDSFKWSNELQSSELNILLYKIMINSIKYYHSSMIKKLIELNGLQKDNKSIDSFVCLNNIYNLFLFVEELPKNENVLKVSQYLVNNGKNEKKNLKVSNKYVSVLIKNAENIEDFRGNPMNLMVRLSGLINNETRVVNNDYNPDWFEEFNVIVSGNTKISSDSSKGGNLKIEVVDASSNNVYKSVFYNVNLNTESIFKNQSEKILLKPKSGSLNINVTVEFEKNDPLFYILICKKELDNSIKRCLNYLIEGYLDDIKKIFTLSNLQKSLIENPIRSENDFKKLQDPYLDTLIGDFQVKVLPQAYNNLETKLFDKLIAEFWEKILSIAENLLLPRLSLINYMINMKLNKNKRKSKSSGNTSSMVSAPSGTHVSTSNNHNQIHETTREELIRVVEWTYKFHAMLEIPDMILQDGLVQPFADFNEIKALFHHPLKKLWEMYYFDWGYSSHTMMSRLSKGSNYDRSRWTKVSRRKQLVLRIILAKSTDQLQKVKKVLESEQRFERTVKTEIEIAYLQQFL